MEEQSFQAAQVMYRKMRDDPDRPETFRLLGREWDLLAGVFAPNYTPVTELFTGWIDFPVGGSFLELGSGTGLTSVMAALAGCASVTAIDISDTAVENTRRNAERHGVADKVRAVRGDLFDALPPDERFDCVYWNSDFIEAPPDYLIENVFQLAFFDPGYRTHRRFLRQAPTRVTDGGRLLLGFNSLGNLALLQEGCAEVGLETAVLNSATHTVSVVVDGEMVSRTLEFRLLELRPPDGRSWTSFTSTAA